MAAENSLITTSIKSHLFSKQALYADQPLNHSYIRAGHTTLTNDILADEIPWFNAGTFSTFLSAWEATKNVLRKNDLIKIGDNIKIRTDIPYNGEEVTESNLNDFLKDFSFTQSEDGNYYLKNKEDKVVIKYHPQENTVFEQLVSNNNSGISTNGVAYRLFNNSIPVERYLSVGDKVLNGYPSTGYVPDVLIDNNIATDGEDFYFNAFNGTILLINATGSNIVKASCFEYIGSYLNSVLDSLDVDINERLTNGIISTTASFDAYIDYNDFVSIPATVEVITYNEIVDNNEIRLEAKVSEVHKTLYEVYNIFTDANEYIDNEGRVYIKSNETVRNSNDNTSADEVIYKLSGATRRSEDIRFIIKDASANIHINSGNIYDSDSNLLKIPADKIELGNSNDKLLVLNVRKTVEGGYEYLYELVSESEYLNRNNLKIPTITKRAR